MSPRDDSAASEDEREPPETERGTLLAGRYAIEALLGTGGMGAVYRARDLNLDEHVAVKMLTTGFDDRMESIQRFRREVKLARRVTHRNVARTFDIGEHDGTHFMTMELITGVSLRAALRGPRLTLDRVGAIVLQLCAGLEAAHAAGVIHRDLKPENVMIEEGGRVVVTDFGIACRADGSEVGGVLLGTPAYMAPEQVLGSPEVDARADLYALGVIFYELLTGERAWRGDTVYKIAADKLSMAPPDPRDACVDLSSDIAEICMRCMAREREARFDSASDVVRALGKALSAEDASALTIRTPPIFVEPPPPTRRSVAVLAFENLGPADDDYIAHGLTEDLIDVLSGNPELRVRARSENQLEHDRDAASVGRALGVEAVVLGSVKRIPSGVHVGIRLVSVADGFQLWARRYEVSLSNVFTIADDAATAVGEAVMRKWAEHPRRPEADAEAIDLYLRARHAYHGVSSDSLDRAIGLFRRGLQRSPEDPKLMAGLAMALARRLNFDGDDAAAHEALAIARRAIALAPDRAEPRIAHANVLHATGDVVGAATEMDVARRRSSAIPDVIDWTGRFVAEAGRIAEGIELLEQARAEDPSRTTLVYEIARLRVLLDKDDVAPEIFDEPLAGAENPCWMTRARIVAWRRDAETARELLPIAQATPFYLRSIVVASFALISGTGDPREVLTELDARRRSLVAKRRRSFICQWAAETSAFAGDREGVVTALEEGTSFGLMDIGWLDHCPLFDAHREDPGFLAIRARIAARAALVSAALPPFVDPHVTRTSGGARRRE